MTSNFGKIKITREPFLSEPCMAHAQKFGVEENELEAASIEAKELRVEWSFLPEFRSSLELRLELDWVEAGVEEGRPSWIRPLLYLYNIVS